MEQRIIDLEQQVHDLTLLLRSLNDTVSTFCRKEIEVIDTYFNDREV